MLVRSPRRRIAEVRWLANQLCSARSYSRSSLPDRHGDANGRHWFGRNLLEGGIVLNCFECGGRAVIGLAEIGSRTQILAVDADQPLGLEIGQPVGNEAAVNVMRLKVRQLGHFHDGAATALLA